MKFNKSLFTNKISIAIAILVASSLIYGLFFYPQKPDPQLAKEVAAEPEPALELSYPHTLAPNSTLFSALRELNVPAQTIAQIVEVAKPIQNLAQLQAGTRFQIFTDDKAVDTVSEKTDAKNSEKESSPITGPMTGIRFRFSAIDSLKIEKVDGHWKVEKITEQVDLKTISFTGEVTSTLWDSAVKAQMDPNLISELADIFAWEVDFSREVRLNDRWRITVEQKLVKGKPIGWGSILAAEYVNDKKPYQAVLYRMNGNDAGYFSPDGASLRKMFLKSPIRYGRITSRFSRKRFHPVLKLFRAHRGIDYGAPIGTPVHAVGDGVITFAQASGGGGKIVKLRHNSTYQTAYKHLSGFAKGIRAGVRVQQGQVIAYVGNTGLSTGPHLHFEFYQNNDYIDPLSRKFPSAEPIPKTQMDQFRSETGKLLATLPKWDIEQNNDRFPSSTEVNTSVQ